jgi:AraC family transcriptional regulator, regulatory protein of adaptative response / methylated-DNA-[protein]-cysteine methyltransferase
MDTDYDRVAKAIEYLIEHRHDQPSLDDVARNAGLSPFHFQRLFRRYAGVTPKQFLAALTLESAKALLDRDASVLDAALDVGLSSPARLHDHFVSIDAMSPGEYNPAEHRLT